MRIKRIEPWIFLFFGVFHLHRIWGLIDRQAYTAFWLGVMSDKGSLYFLLMGLLSALCIAGIGIFLTHLRANPWWRWIYPLCGGYLLFDLFAIAAGWSFWHALIDSMFDISSPYWNVVWGAFILLGCASMLLGVTLFRQRVKSKG